MAIRSIVHIDEEKCDGCGECVPSCEEGAIKIVNGKAKVVSDIYCDGLGACLGHCPQGAISIVQRDAEDFDETAVARHLATTDDVATESACGSGCPGTKTVDLRPNSQPTRRPLPTPGDQTGPVDSASNLGNWPVQLHLVPPQAPYLQGADLLLVADCVPFACADFHARVLDGRPVVIGCPKLDDCEFYVSKLAAIIRQAGIRRISVLHMEVPCCTGLLRVAEAAIQQAQVAIPLDDTVVTISGELIERPTQHPVVNAGTSTLAPTGQLPIL